MSVSEILRIISEDEPNIDALSQVLAANTTLDLSHDNVGDKGVTALAQALPTNTSLRTLDLYCNDVGTEGATALGRALGPRGNTTLQTLDLYLNKVGDEGATALAQALTTNTTLEILDLDSNTVGDKGAIALAKVLIVNTTLQTLDIRRNNEGDEGVVALAQALKVNTTLQDLYVGDSSDLVDQSLLKRNRAMHRAKPLRVAILLGVQERPKVYQQIRTSLKDGDEQYVKDVGEATLFTRRPLYTVDIGVIILMYFDEMEHITYNYC